MPIYTLFIGEEINTHKKVPKVKKKKNKHKGNYSGYCPLLSFYDTNAYFLVSDGYNTVADVAGPHC